MARISSLAEGVEATVRGRELQARTGRANAEAA
jgi:hypothetical protein